MERFHGTFRPDLLDVVEPFTSIEAAQTAVDAWVAGYNTERPHQGLDQDLPVTPAERFAPVPAAQRGSLPLWLPTTLEPVATAPVPTASASRESAAPEASAGQARVAGDPVELDKQVPASGNMSIAGQQFWLGPARAGQTVRFWIDCDLVHLSIGGTRIKTVRSHLSVNDLDRLVGQGAHSAGPPPLPGSVDNDDGVVEVERVVARSGTIALGGKVILAAEILAGRQVGVRIEAQTLMFFDLDTRELLRTRPNPLQPGQVQHLRGVRPTGPPPRPSTEPIRVQRRASNTGVIMVAGQRSPWAGCTNTRP